MINADILEYRFGNNGPFRQVEFVNNRNRIAIEYILDGKPKDVINLRLSGPDMNILNPPPSWLQYNVSTDGTGTVIDISINESKISGEGTYVAELELEDTEVSIYLNAISTDSEEEQKQEETQSLSDRDILKISQDLENKEKVFIKEKNFDIETREKDEEEKIFELNPVVIEEKNREDLKIKNIEKENFEIEEQRKKLQEIEDNIRKLDREGLNPKNREKFYIQIDLVKDIQQWEELKGEENEKRFDEICQYLKIIAEEWAEEENKLKEVEEEKKILEELEIILQNILQKGFREENTIKKIEKIKAHLNRLQMTGLKNEKNIEKYKELQEQTKRLYSYFTEEKRKIGKEPEKRLKGEEKNLKNITEPVIENQRLNPDIQSVRSSEEKKTEEIILEEPVSNKSRPFQKVPEEQKTEHTAPIPSQKEKNMTFIAVSVSVIIIVIIALSVTGKYFITSSISQAKNEANKDNYSNAISIINNRIIRNDPNNLNDDHDSADLLLVIARNYKKKGDMERDKSNYGAAGENYKESLNTYRMLEYINKDIVRKEMREVYDSLYGLYMKQEKYDLAKDILDELFKIDKKNLTLPYRETGDSFLKKKDFEKAMDCFNKLLELKPGDQYGISGLIDCYRGMIKKYKENNDYDKVIEYSQKILNQKKGDIQAYIDTGEACYNKNVCNKAIEWLQKALKLKPTPDKSQNKKINSLMAKCYVKLGQNYLTSYKSKHKALQILEKQKTFEEGKKYFEKALNFDRDNKEAKEGLKKCNEELAGIYTKNGNNLYEQKDYEKAKKEFNKVISLNVDEKLKQEARNKLVSIENILHPAPVYNNPSQGSSSAPEGGDNISVPTPNVDL